VDSIRCRIVPLEARHIAAILQIHVQAFPSFFLTSLGPVFLKEFYHAFLHDEGALAFVAEDMQGKVCGIVVGTLLPKGFFKRLLARRWWAFALASVPALVHTPAIAPRLARALWYRGETQTNLPRALLSSIAVDPSLQGGGLGRRLIGRWLNEARRRGSAGCYLLTDAIGNEAVNAFYRHTGWRLETTNTTPEGRRMNRYVFDFNRTENR
jgi:GNAT superfamily N-acetyltransferase